MDVNRSTQNRLIVGALTVLLAASTAAVASSVEPGEADADLAAGRSAAPSGGGSGSPAAGLGAPVQPSVGSVSRGSRPTGASTSAGTGSRVPPVATPSGGTDEAPESGGAGESADPGEPAPLVDAAVLTPLLRTMAFGTSFAVKGVGCNLGGSLVGSVTTQLGLSEVASGAILDGVDACVQLAATSIVVLEQLAEASTALSVLNPVVDPLLEVLATNVEILGTRYAAQLAPLGETVATLGPTIRYLIGGEDEGAG